MSSRIDKLRLPNESDVSWSLRKEFIERYRGDFPEETLLSLAKVYSDVESGGCSNPVPVPPSEAIIPKHEQQQPEVSQDTCRARREDVTVSSVKEKQGTRANSRNKRAIKAKKRASHASNSGASSRKRKCHGVYRSDTQSQDEVLIEIAAKKKSKLPGLKSSSECSVVSKENDDITLESKSSPQNKNQEFDNYETMNELDALEKAKAISYQFSLGEKVLEINTWPKNLKENFISILQFVRKCFARELSTSEIMHSISKMFNLKLHYRTKQVSPSKNRFLRYECTLKIDSTLLGKGSATTLKKARIAAAKEVIDKLMKLSREVGNLSSVYFKKSGKFTESKERENTSKNPDPNMNDETECTECTDGFDSSSDINKDIQNSSSNDSLPPCSDSLQMQVNKNHDEVRQNSEGMTEIRHFTKGLKSDAVCEGGTKSGLNTDSRSDKLSTAESDPMSDVNSSPLINENSFGGGMKRKLNTEVVEQSIEDETESCKFKKVIKFSNGFCVAFGFDKNNQLVDVNAHDRPKSGSEAVQGSIGEVSKKITVDVKSSGSSELDAITSSSCNSVTCEGSQCLENVGSIDAGGESKQNSTEGRKEKLLKNKMMSNNCQFSSTGNPNVPSMSTEKLVHRGSDVQNKNLNLFANNREQFQQGMGQRQSGSSVTGKTAGSCVEHNLSQNLEVAADVTGNTLPIQNAFNASNHNASNLSQRSTKCIKPRTKACNNNNGRESLQSISRPTSFVNIGINNYASNVNIFTQGRTPVHYGGLQNSADYSQAHLYAESSGIFSCAFRHIENLIIRLTAPVVILNEVSHTFSVDVRFNYRFVPNVGHECFLVMDNILMCKAYGFTERKAHAAACKLAIYKLMEFAVEIGIIHFNRLVSLLTWYNSKVPPDAMFPIKDLSCSYVEFGNNMPVAASQVMSRNNFQVLETSNSSAGPTNELNPSTCESSCEKICSAFVAILDYSDIAEREDLMLVLKVAAELNCVKIKFRSEEVVASDTGKREIRASILCGGNEFSSGTGKNKHIAKEAASKVALDMLKRTVYTIKMKYEHFSGFLTKHDQLPNIRKNRNSFRTSVEQILKNHRKTFPDNDLMFCAFNGKERDLISNVAVRSGWKAYSIGGKYGQPRNLIVTKFVTAADLVKHLTETGDNNCKLKYELIPPSQ